MKEKFCLELSLENDFMGLQSFCFPIAVFMSDAKFKNWYYTNYMIPIVRLKGVSILSYDIVDSFMYGSNSSMNNKIMRMNSVNADFCAQIKDINDVLKKELANEYYCVLFLDCYYLSPLQWFYHNIHYAHEVLFYGYDDSLRIYKCYGYLDNSYQRFELSYDEVEQGFKEALKYVRERDGWDEYMFITMDIVLHETDYPYINDSFIEKLKLYIEGEIPCKIYYENRFYMKRTQGDCIVSGINIIDAFCNYVNTLCTLLENNTLYDSFVNQLNAFNMFWSFHVGMLKRLRYFADINGLSDKLEHFILDYDVNIVRRSKLVRMLYVKLICQVERKYKISNILQGIAENLNQIKTAEKEIISKYIEAIADYC